MARPLRIRKSKPNKNGDAHRISLVVNTSEKESFEDEAGRENRSVSNWMKTTLVERVTMNRLKRGQGV